MLNKYFKLLKIFVLPGGTGDSADQVNFHSWKMRVSFSPRLVGSAVEQSSHSCSTAAAKFPCTILLEQWPVNIVPGCHACPGVLWKTSAQLLQIAGQVEVQSITVFLSTWDVYDTWKIHQLCNTSELFCCSSGLQYHSRWKLLSWSVLCVYEGT